MNDASLQFNVPDSGKFTHKSLPRPAFMKIGQHASMTPSPIKDGDSFLAPRINLFGFGSQFQVDSLKGELSAFGYAFLPPIQDLFEGKTTLPINETTQHKGVSFTVLGAVFGVMDALAPFVFELLKMAWIDGKQQILV
jgi:hypothetical protein